MTKGKMKMIKKTVYLGEYVHVVMVSVGHFELALDCRASH